MFFFIFAFIFFTFIILSLNFIEYCYIFSSSLERGPGCVVANVLNCDIVVSEFELQLRHYIHFLANTHGKCTKPL